MMQPQKFPSEVIKRLSWYVYRLVDPRNGETFYVGKGKGDRIFQHAKGAMSASGDEDAGGLKYKRINQIRAAGLEVAHVIHRHGIDTENVAYQIEAALIDAYPGLANQVGGHNSGDYGVRHVVEIINEYSAEPFEAKEPLILISIGPSIEEEGRTVYDAVRCCWVIKLERARKYNLVLAHQNGIVIGAFRPSKWMHWSPENFPNRDGVEKRCGFVGDPADEDTARLYVRKRVPVRYRAKGAANPVRFIDLPPVAAEKTA